VDGVDQLHKRAVAHELDDAAGMRGDRRLDQFALQRVQPGLRPGYPTTSADKITASLLCRRSSALRRRPEEDFISEGFFMAHEGGACPSRPRELLWLRPVFLAKSGITAAYVAAAGPIFEG
jgi:hypothetical protein